LDEQPHSQQRLLRTHQARDTTEHGGVAGRESTSITSNNLGKERNLDGAPSRRIHPAARSEMVSPIRQHSAPYLFSQHAAAPSLV
jgi:hypothetical protein